MSESAKITLARLRKMAGPEVERLLAEVTEAINQAPDGAVIVGSEEAVREAMERFRRRVYELGIQLRTDAAKAVSPPLGRMRRVSGSGTRGRRPSAR